MEDFHFGKNLQKIRDAKGFTQFKLAVDMNISQGLLSKIESEPYVPRDHIFEAAAKALDTSTRELLPPEWFIKTVTRDGYVLSGLGHVVFIILLGIQCVALIIQISNGTLQSTMAKVLLSVVVVAVAGLFYYLSVTKTKKTKYK